MKQVLLEIALEAARQAGDVLLARRGEDHDVERKGYRDVVTAADRAAEESVLSVSSPRRPGPSPAPPPTPG
jgi:fructose-1,6-bisphosphatase/inositol monophosphatase family enzyme